MNLLPTSSSFAPGEPAHFLRGWKDRYLNPRLMGKLWEMILKLLSFKAIGCSERLVQRLQFSPSDEPAYRTPTTDS